MQLLTYIITIIVLFLSFILGGSIGSFIGVLLDRIPKKEDFVKKRSYCPNCNKEIPWKEKIPIFSFILLKGRCSKCNYKIPSKLFILELIFGLISLLIFSVLIIPAFNF